MLEDNDYENEEETYDTEERTADQSDLFFQDWEDYRK
jgi:hypothetical protein